MVRDEIVNPRLQTDCTTFLAHCKTFNESLLDIMRELNSKLRSLSGPKKFLLSSSIKADIQKHQERIHECRANFLLWIVMQNRLAVHQVHNSIHEMRHDISQLPRSLGYPWEASGEFFLLFDMMDICTQLPISLCQTWETFLDLLLLMHKNRPGLRYVTLGNFDLTRTRNNNRDQVVLSTTWNPTMINGSTVKMSAVLRRSEEQDSRQCPSCSTVESQPVDLGAEIQCGNCGTRFRVSRGYIVEESTSQMEDTPAAEPLSVSPGSEEGEALLVVQNDIQYLRRFHVVLPPRQLSPPRPIQ
ncbi:hypothetical protein C8J56DRAFT_483158 [Mycena floridula]|nr:hypothetical protein C8J56DRAFT_483158 [Mycena floridula]